MTRFAGGPIDTPGFLLWHATLRWQRTVAAALAPLGLTHVQFVLLACTWWLNEHGDPPNQLALATQAGTDVKMTSQVVRRLIRDYLTQHGVAYVPSGTAAPPRAKRPSPPSAAVRSAPAVATKTRSRG